jgi:ABC-type Fe3+ transport system permease subunit
MSLFLIGAALALAGVVGLFLPLGSRAGVLLPLLAGIGVGIAGVAIGSSFFENGDLAEFWHTFFISSIAGFIAVVVGLMLLWRRSRPVRAIRPRVARSRPGD